MTIKIVNKDCISAMKDIEDNTIDCCVTSPPYWGLRDYGVDGQIGLEASMHDYLNRMVEVCREVNRILKPEGTFWLNVGDSYYNYRPGKGQALVKQSVSSTNQDLPQSCARRGLKQGNLKEKDLCMIPNRLAIMLQDDGWYVRSEIIWHKPNPMPESVKDRPTNSHEKVWLLTKSSNYYYNTDAIKEQGVIPAGTKAAKGSAERFNMQGVNSRPPEYKTYDGFRNARNVWSIATKPFKGAHFATMPVELAEKCIKAGSPDNGLIFDPFGGAGTTAVAAVRNNRNAIISELNPTYCSIAHERIASELGIFFDEIVLDMKE